MAGVVLRQLGKTFTGSRGVKTPAVDDVSLEISPGEFLSVVGPSGCGKTTLLRLIAGLEQPDQGEVFLNGLPANHLDPGDRDVAMVFQNHALYPHMTVRGNLEFGLQIRKLSSAVISERVAETAGWLGLENLLDSLPGQLSGGENQRVALGRAIIRRPSVLLLDEPLSNLDLPLRRRMRADLARLHERLGTTVIHVTHDQSEAMCLGRRIAVLQQGRLVQVATPLEIYRNPATPFVATFIGEPPMNLFEGTICPGESGSELVFMESIPRNRDSRLASSMPDGVEEAAFTVPIPQPLTRHLYGYQNRPVTLGIRPESLERMDSKRVDRAGAGGGSDAGVISTRVERVEHPGPEIWVHFKTAGHDGIARLPNNPDEIQSGGRLLLRPDAGQLRFFDSGKAIPAGP